ncbi:GNAT family N-acetyltransferase [Diaphorobacter ruginosibacter]|uniref:GNAT family N-acetyltransferase n=1 Tax=Diaphorobacter ruginosibacter TaxID=1715720 RepID=UPI0033418191
MTAMAVEGAPADLRVGALVLRPVRPDDYPFLRSVYREVRRPELAASGWTEQEMDAFCDAQFTLQDRHYRAHYPYARYFVIELEGVRIGRLYLSDGPDLLALMEVSLSVRRRGQGHGTQLVRWVTQQADATGRRARLFVEPDNPAKRLYERLGFVDSEIQGAYMKMFREPQPVNTAQTTAQTTGQAAAPAPLNRD